MMAYLTEEAEGKAKNAMFICSYEQLTELDSSIAEFRQAETQHQRTVYNVSAARDKAARHASMQVCCVRVHKPPPRASAGGVLA
jgi:hypothetical protein